MHPALANIATYNYSKSLMANKIDIIAMHIIIKSIASGELCDTWEYV